MTAAQGFATRMTVGGTQLSFRRNTLGMDERFISGDGIRGTRSRSAEQQRAGEQVIGGQIEAQPTAVEWATWLPLILGGTPSGTSYPMAETMQTAAYVVDKVTKVCTYSSVGINRATIRASKGQPVTLTLDVVALTESVANAGTGTWPGLDITTQPFIFEGDLALTHNGNTVQPFDYEWIFDNHLDTERFLNSPTLTAIVPQDRSLMIRTNLPYGDNAIAYGTAVAGVVVNATFTNGTVSLAFNHPAVSFPRTSPTINGRNELILPLNGQALKTGSTPEVAVTLDSTP